METNIQKILNEKPTLINSTALKRWEELRPLNLDKLIKEKVVNLDCNNKLYDLTYLDLDNK